MSYAGSLEVSTVINKNELYVSVTRIFLNNNMNFIKIDLLQKFIKTKDHPEQTFFHNEMPYSPYLYVIL